jgi:maleate isomerase
LQRLVAYLSEHQIDTVSHVGLGLVRDWEISTLPPMDLVELVRQADAPQAEAIFLSDTCLVLSPVVAALEADLGKPVFSANMATMWHALRLAGVNDACHAPGSLFRLPTAREPPLA